MKIMVLVLFDVIYIGCENNGDLLLLILMVVSFFLFEEIIFNVGGFLL